MYKSKLIEIFKSFNRKEKLGFRRWVNSPIHNQHKDVIKLTNFLFSRRKLTPISIQRERVYKHLYPNSKYNLHRLNHVLSFTLEVMEAYIQFITLQDKPIEELFFLSEFYQKKSLPHLAQKNLEKAQDALNDSPYHNDFYYHHSFLLEQSLFELKGTELRQHQTNLQAIFSDLTTFTIVATLKNACTAISHGSLYKNDYQIPLLDAILEEAQTDTYKNNTVVKSYYHCYRALTQPNEEIHFKIVKKLLLEGQIPLPISELKYIYLLVTNYCIKRLNTDAEMYVKEVFEIYSLGLEQNIWLEGGYISHSTFKNIATAALRLKAYQWVDNFVQKYSPQIKPYYRKAYTNYIRAKILFEQDQILAAQQILIDTDAIDLFISLAIKLLSLKIYWQLNEFDLLEAHLDSFSVFLNRKKVLAYHRQIYGNIISITRKMIYAKMELPAEREKLRQLIFKTSPLTERPWLLEQLHSNT
ncbi:MULTISPECIES: hypothetical protein [unclassified Aureispira]|uniref:hypothetical protein n=1 Tax=unclassified Aureispira TaxID=2649989 RepID=UPI0006974119|nr:MULTISPECIES: hypothetical protein [unclassified Aureispira]WMX14973.1 hypothetical protein QP953_01155 [Aureispira sp. CCB-E]